ncbi:MAG: GAF domain-containing protein, partial [Bdellovibrionia bacterium]
MEDLEYSKLRTDLSNCDRELIHIPGTIQAFGILICLSDPGLQICNFSANIISTLGYTLEEFLSQSFFSLVRAEDHTFLNELVKAKGSKVKNPYAIALKKSDGKYLPFLAFLHRSENNLILELEPLEDNPPILMDLYRETISSISALQGVESLTELCQRATEAVQSLTGFDRVMIYQFDPNWNGHVIAEALSSVGKVDSYKGHHFPASDIPSQSRAVLLQNWLRMIPDVDCKPVPILPSAGPLSQRPLNLSRAFLRSVSPIHIRYLKNMGVVSSLTVSLKHEGRLWGLISCHHRKAYLVSHSARVVCRLIGRHISSLLGITGEVEDLHYLRKLRSIHDSLVKFMLAEEDLIQGLIKYSPNLLDLAASKGASAAIYLGKGWTLVGRTPEIPQIEALVDWLIHHHSKEDVFYTHSLSSLVPEAIAYKDVASGLLAINIPRTENSYILWFRPEIPKVVTWAGDPNKNVEILPDGTLKIEPRSSFEAWIENVQNQALDWRPVEIEAARTLRTSILGIDLQRLVKKEQEARTRAEELVLQREKDIHQLRSERILRESFVATLTHDLRTPLTAARLSAQLINMNPADKDRAQKQSEKIFLNIDRVDQMITDLLDANQIRAGQKLS